MEKTIYLTMILLFGTFLNAQQKATPKAFYEVHNPEFSYHYSIPSDTNKELIETGKDREVHIYSSINGNFTIRIFSENYFDRSQKQEMLEKYYQDFLSGRHAETENLVVTESQINFKDGSFLISGTMKNKEIALKTLVSEIPVSGELICNTVIFSYTGSQTRKLGKILLDRFGR